MRKGNSAIAVGADRACSGSLDVLGLPLSTVTSLEEAFGLVCEQAHAASRTSRLFTFVNPLGVQILRKHEQYAADLARMDAVFCDGIGLALATRWFHRFPLHRVSFDSTSLAPPLFGFARDGGQSVAIVGGRPGVAEVAAERIKDAFPGIRIVATMDGFIPQATLVSRLQALSPDIVICGMGAPRQEHFLVSLADAGWNGMGFTCGGYLDHLGAKFDFYPPIVDRLNLRWLYRIAREPRRIGYRFFVEYAPFWRGLARHAFALTRYPIRAEDRS